jgi:hypothetical protein
MSKAGNEPSQQKIKGIVQTEGEEKAQCQEQERGLEVGGWGVEIGGWTLRIAGQESRTEKGDKGQGQAGDADVGDVFDVLRGHGLHQSRQQCASQVTGGEREGNPLMKRQPLGAHGETRKLPRREQLYRRHRSPKGH